MWYLHNHCSSLYAGFGKLLYLHEKLLHEGTGKRMDIKCISLSLLQSSFSSLVIEHAYLFNLLKPTGHVMHQQV